MTMANDHLDNELSVSAEITPTGVKAGARSRFLSAVDRLLGGVVDIANVPLERVAQTGRARTTGEVAYIEALQSKRLEQLQNDPDVAERALNHHYGTVLKRRENMAAVVTLAIEDLRNEPPSDEQNMSGDDSLDEGFTNRFERYAEDATSDQLRERWGRVLAAEIRTPGTFSVKVMRVVDELDPTTAALFERVCKHRVGDTLIKCLVGDLSFPDREKLVSAGLVVEPGLAGHIRRSTAGTEGLLELDFLVFGHSALGVPKGVSLPEIQPDHAPPPVIADNGSPAVPVYVLTSAGQAISSIISHDESSVLQQFFSQTAALLGPAVVREYRADTAGQMKLCKIWNSSGDPLSAAIKAGPR